ncbi:hypothetical protein ACFUOZ_08835 [Paenarthrobacter sp. NPDC057355]|uniref:hypothetical protein n=1 Tax=Paenarthrobacter sp. NPDC057355 TaxID=3346105 RepID=UPI00363376CB
MTDHPTSFTTRELREVFDVLMRHVEERHGSTIDVGVDYFWSIPPDAIYDVYDQPTELTIGQLTESLDNIRRVAADPDRAISYALVWLGDVLRATGHKLVS